MPFNWSVKELGEKGEGLRSTDWKLQNSHGDVKYTTGNIVNNIIMYGARWILEIGKLLCKLYGYLTTMLYT